MATYRTPLILAHPAGVLFPSVPHRVYLSAYGLDWATWTTDRDAAQRILTIEEADAIVGTLAHCGQPAPYIQEA